MRKRQCRSARQLVDVEEPVVQYIEAEVGVGVVEAVVEAGAAFWVVERTYCVDGSRRQTLLRVVVRYSC
jgi:hypothetical protein